MAAVGILLAPGTHVYHPRCCTHFAITINTAAARLTTRSTIICSSSRFTGYWYACSCLHGWDVDMVGLVAGLVGRGAQSVRVL